MGLVRAYQGEHLGLQLETLWHFGLVSFVAAVSPPGAVPSLAEAAGGEATRSTPQASLPVSFIIEAHFGSMAELLRPCPGQSLPRQGRLKASARGPTESGLIGGLDWGFRLFQRCSGHCRRHVGARNTADCRHSVTV